MGPDVDLIYDAVFAHTRQEALAVGRELERLGYFWYEAPLPPDDIEGYVDLRSRVDVPLTVELIYATQYREYVRRQAVTYLRTLSGIRGGHHRDAQGGGGFVHGPRRPGLGLPIDWEQVAAGTELEI